MFCVQLKTSKHFAWGSEGETVSFNRYEIFNNYNQIRGNSTMSDSP